MDTIVKAENLLVQYKRLTALEIDHLELFKGESFGLVGNNGAGKTTFFRVILDLVKPKRGRVTINGMDSALSEDWKNTTGAYLDEGFVIPYLLPEEYFAFVAKTRGISQGEMDRQLAGFEQFFNGQILGKGKYIRDLSRGNQKKVGVAAAFLGNPDLIILDEPFSNLDPSSQLQLRRILSVIDTESDTTIVVSSHDLTHISAFCKRIVILDEGKVVKDIYSNERTLEKLQTYFSWRIELQ
ncbi:MAG: ABC transporter ATP-binding protein [Saprospirales bacterium]|nr:MAG: ABC transporter ATP-binding protein [Saprospirales bacterium]